MLRPIDGTPRTVNVVQAMVRTAHQANGALLLGATVVLGLRAFRHLAPPAASARRDPVPAPLDLEAVA